jgi:hypothetical protein
MMPSSDTHDITLPNPRPFVRKYRNAIFLSSFVNIAIPI